MLLGDLRAADPASHGSRRLDQLPRLWPGGLAKVEPPVRVRIGWEPRACA